jgi:hypothetical protein
VTQLRGRRDDKGLLTRHVLIAGQQWHNHLAAAIQARRNARLTGADGF